MQQQSESRIRANKASHVSRQNFSQDEITFRHRSMGFRPFFAVDATRRPSAWNADEDFPAGTGHRPFFPRPQLARLDFPPRRRAGRRRRSRKFIFLSRSLSGPRAAPEPSYGLREIYSNAANHSAVNPDPPCKAGCLCNRSSGYESEFPDFQGIPLPVGAFIDRIIEGLLCISAL